MVASTLHPDYFINDNGVQTTDTKKTLKDSFQQGARNIAASYFEGEDPNLPHPCNEYRVNEDALTATFNLVLTENPAGIFNVPSSLCAGLSIIFTRGVMENQVHIVHYDTILVHLHRSTQPPTLIIPPPPPQVIASLLLSLTFSLSLSLSLSPTHCMMPLTNKGPEGGPRM
jgi:hypothetical protein